MRQVKHFLLWFVILVFISGCATTREKDGNKPVRAPFWPSLPDLPRFEYEYTLRTDLDIADPGTFESFKAMAMGLDDQPRIRLIKPLDVAAAEGRIIISDSVMRLVYLFDIPHRITVAFGMSGDGKLVKPLGVAIDKDVNFYVTDAGNRNIAIYDSGGHFQRRIGHARDLTRPTDVAVSPDGQRIYVVDAGGISSRRHRIVVYDQQGRLQFVIGTRGTGPGKFNLPTHVAVAPDGTLYVLDTGNFRVQAFSPDGEFITSWGGLGSGLGNFSRPRGIAVDQDGNIYVSDANFGNVQIFNPKGQLLMALGRGGTVDQMGVYSLVAGVAVDETRRLYIVDQSFQKVEVIKRLSRQEGEAIMREYGIDPAMAEDH